jgi:Cu(I)/Ag(I) efflux system membrane fusion protein
VRGVDPAALQVKLEHEPIDQLGWPAMTMNFSVDPSISLDSLAAGQSIHFSMVETEKNRWVIDQIHVMDEVTEEAGQDHD